MKTMSNSTISVKVDSEAPFETVREQSCDLFNLIMEVELLAYADDVDIIKTSKST